LSAYFDYYYLRLELVILGWQLKQDLTFERVESAKALNEYVNTLPRIQPNALNSFLSGLSKPCSIMEYIENFLGAVVDIQPYHESLPPAQAGDHQLRAVKTFTHQQQYTFAHLVTMETNIGYLSVRQNKITPTQRFNDVDGSNTCTLVCCEWIMAMLGALLPFAPGEHLAIPVSLFELAKKIRYEFRKDYPKEGGKQLVGVFKKAIIRKSVIAQRVNMRSGMSVSFSKVGTDDIFKLNLYPGLLFFNTSIPIGGATLDSVVNQMVDMILDNPDMPRSRAVVENSPEGDQTVEYAVAIESLSAYGIIISANEHSTCLLVKRHECELQICYLNSLNEAFPILNNNTFGFDGGVIASIIIGSLLTPSRSSFITYLKQFLRYYVLSRFITGDKFSSRGIKQAIQIEYLCQLSEVEHLIQSQTPGFSKTTELIADAERRLAGVRAAGDNESLDSRA
jgi:hypothetical protein